LTLGSPLLANTDDGIFQPSPRAHNKTPPIIHLALSLFPEKCFNITNPPFPVALYCRNNFIIKL
jgi:hypothetical protein